MGLTVAVNNGKGSWRVKTPGSVVIHKAYGDLKIVCKKEGLKHSTGDAYRSSANNGVFGNILLGGVIGYAVDASNGAGFDYPQTMTIAFDPPCQSPWQPGQLPIHWPPRWSTV